MVTQGFDPNRSFQTIHYEPKLLLHLKRWGNNLILFHALYKPFTACMSECSDADHMWFVRQTEFILLIKRVLRVHFY